MIILLNNIDRQRSVIMKKEYMRPVMVSEKFVANEYVAACGDSGTVYYFECNAGDKDLNDYPYEVYVDYSGYDNYFYRNTYHACGITHTAESNSGFYNGYMDDKRTTGNDRIPVIVWTEYGRDTHCPTNLDMSKWETQKS